MLQRFQGLSARSASSASRIARCSMVSTPMSRMRYAFRSMSTSSSETLAEHKNGTVS